MNRYIKKINKKALVLFSGGKDSLLVTLKLLDKEITENPVAYPSQEVLNKCETFIDLGDKIKLYDRAWIELKSE